MAFDSGLLSCIVNELNKILSNSRVEKVFQPEKDEIVMLIRKEQETLRLSLSASSNNPRINITKNQKENPLSPPMFCMLLRKHISGAKIVSVKQNSFERVYEILFETRDEMGFACNRKIIGEIMGKHSNIIFCDGDNRIISPLKVIDFTTSSKRQVLPGMIYENPPSQGKADIFDLTYDNFEKIYRSDSGNTQADRFISSNLLGISSLVARELSYTLTGSVDTPIKNIPPEKIYKILGLLAEKIREGGIPSLVRDENGRNIEYSFIPIRQYGGNYSCLSMDSFSKLIDEYFTSRDLFDRIRQKSSDIHRIISNNISRLSKKIALIGGEIKDCGKKDLYKKYGDLIISSIYLIKRGDKSVILQDYSAESCPAVEVELDERLTPSQNAQRYYKKYAKSKKAELELAKQKELAENELVYMKSVLDSLERTNDINSLDQLRKELEKTGYIRTKANSSTHKKSPASSPLSYTSPGGLAVLCGRNNIQNDEITFKLAGKNDWWFHVKNSPGSHVILFSGKDEPMEDDFTFASKVAAANSSLKDSGSAEVDYTQVKNLKKPPSSLPGFVIYHTNYTAFVKKDGDSWI